MFDELRAGLNTAFQRINALELSIANKVDRDEANTLIDGKLHTTQSSGYHKPVLESKAMQEVAKVADAKQYRAWNKKMKNALEQSRTKSRRVLEMIEKMTEEEVTEELNLGGHPSMKDAIKGVAKIEYPGHDDEIDQKFDELDRDMWAVLCAKTEGEAEEKVDACNQGEGLWAYMRLHKWLSGSRRPLLKGNR